MATPKRRKAPRKTRRAAPRRNAAPACNPRRRKAAPKRRRAPARRNPVSVPPLGDWDMSGGGTGAARGKHGYSTWVDDVRCYIDPVSVHGRHQGYSVTTFGGGNHWRWITPDGDAQAGGWTPEQLVRSPQAGVTALRKHLAKSLRGH